MFYSHILILYVDSLSIELTGILPHLESMCKASESGEQVDSLEISAMHERLLLLVADHRTKAKLLNMLGDICTECYNSGEVNALHRAVTIYSDAVQQARGYFELMYWNDLGICLGNCFKKMGDLSDLKRSIQIFEDAIVLTPDGHTEKCQASTRTTSYII